MTHPLSRPLLLMLLLAGPLPALAVGLGEMRGGAVLGERLRVEVDIIGADRRYPEASCFRLIRPAAGGELPWLQGASLSVRGGAKPVLEIRSTAILRDPVMQVGVQLGCGYEISRDYTLLAMPASEAEVAKTVSAADAGGNLAEPVAAPRRPVRRAVPRDGEQTAQRLAPPRRAELPRQPAADRLLLSGGGESGDGMLRMATELASLNGGLSASEAQREILRLEFRMLMALGAQADTQLSTAEKLRNMESTLGELQARAADFASRVEQGAAPAAPAVQPVKPVAPITAQPESADSAWLPSVNTYALLMGALFGVAGWLGWRAYERRRRQREEDEFPLLSSEPAADVQPQAEPAAVQQSALDIDFEPAGGQLASRVDLELDGGDMQPIHSGGEEARRPRHDSALSVAESTVNEHFEANPVMELADIMLSFGRVKGAAQALREYIDSNPQEALQPWIRLMDVYRMAGMRNEFEEVARNLNLHFNVEVQHWDDAVSAGGAADQPRPESLEDMPRIMGMIVELWWTGDVVGYLYQLLRDNRGGKRAGFALPLVEEILFLIELKETSNRIEEREEQS